MARLQDAADRNLFYPCNLRALIKDAVYRFFWLTENDVRVPSTLPLFHPSTLPPFHHLTILGLPSGDRKTPQELRVAIGSRQTFRSAAPRSNRQSQAPSCDVKGWVG